VADHVQRRALAEVQAAYRERPFVAAEPHAGQILRALQQAAGR
jgi:hypothetical protein